MWPFKKKGQETDLAHSRDEFLLGDNSTTYSISDFVIHPGLTGSKDEIDHSVERIFERGNLDPRNDDLFDNMIDSKVVIALRDLNKQYSLRPDGIKKMYAWHERDVCDLQERIEKHKNNLEQALAEYKEYELKAESLKFNKRKGGTENGKAK